MDFKQPNFEQPSEEKDESKKGFEIFLQQLEKDLGIKSEADRIAVEAKRKSEGEAMAEKQAEKEKAYKEIEPMLKRLEKMEQMEDYFKGGQWFYALKNNLTGFSDWLKKSRDNILEKNKITGYANEKYKEITGEDYFCSTSLSQKELEDLWNEVGYKSGDVMKQEQNSLKRVGPVTGKTRERVDTVEDLITEMENYRDYMTTEKYYGKKPAKYEVDIMDNVYGFQRVAQGMTLAALESGEINVAAKAMAFAQNIEEVSADILKQIETALSKLPETEQKNFILKFEKYSQERKMRLETAGR